MATDEQLVRRIRRGEVEAFDELYQRYSRKLLSYIFRFVQDRDQAEDLLQDVLLRVLRDRSFDLQRGRFGAWLFTVARNACLSHLRDDRRRQLKARASGEVAQWSGAAPSPEEAAQLTEQVAALQDAVATLPQSQQDALVLKQLGQMTYREIARIQGVPEGTVKSRLHLAIRHVQRWLAPPADSSEEAT